MNKPSVKISLTHNLFFMASQYINKNWKVFIKNTTTNNEELIDKSITQEELKFLINEALNYSFETKKPNIKKLKEKFKSLIKNNTNICEE